MLLQIIISECLKCTALSSCCIEIVIVAEKVINKLYFE